MFRLRALARSRAPSGAAFSVKCVAKCVAVFLSFCVEGNAGGADREAGRKLRIVEREFGAEHVRFEKARFVELVKCREFEKPCKGIHVGFRRSASANLRKHVAAKIDFFRSRRRGKFAFVSLLQCLVESSVVGFLQLRDDEDEKKESGEGYDYRFDDAPEGDERAALARRFRLLLRLRRLHDADFRRGRRRRRRWRRRRLEGVPAGRAVYELAGGNVAFELRGTGRTSQDHAEDNSRRTSAGQSARTRNGETSFAKTPFQRRVS